MVKRKSEYLIKELQTLTGIVTDDISYLCYLILREGCYFNHEEEEEAIDEKQMPSFDEWFQSL